MIETFEHTADVGLRVRAADLNALFAGAGRGLFSLIVENLDGVRPLTSRRVELDTDRLDDLLFDWLSELLYLFDTAALVLCGFDVEVAGTRLRADVSGESLAPSRMGLAHEVKAVTYHGLVVRPDRDGWLADVIVDI